MTGADEAAYQSMVGLSSRVMTFPDGLARHITLSNREWNVVDWLEHEAGWLPQDLPELCFSHALTFWFNETFNRAAHAAPADERRQFEEQLIRSLRSHIRVSMARASGLEDATNDEFKSLPKKN